MAQKKASGATLMRQMGYRLVSLWFTPEELAIVAAAAGKTPLATWVKRAAFHAATAENRKQDRRRRRECSDK